MCGIFGITENNPQLVKEMMNKTSHRGPDGNNIFLSEHLTLGHNLLSITSNPNDGVQPWLSNRGNVLIYNGEIFNYNELIKKYSDQFKRKTTCDTELLSWLLDEFPYEKVISEMIDSMHSFVFFNKTNNELILSRDHVGIKPLFFSINKNGLIFSSEIKSLLNYVKDSNKINRIALACTSFLGANVLRETVFNGIFKILPGETIIYNLSKKKIINSFRTLVKPFSNKQYNKDEFTEITYNTIKNSILGVRKFGIFLSGGLDSSLLAYELSDKINNLNSFTNKMNPNVIIDGEDHNSDAKVAKKFASHLKLNHKEVEISPKVLLENWDASINAIEEPRYNWNLPMYYYTNKFLSNNNVIVTMAGDIGDEIYGGYQKYINFRDIKNKPKKWRDFLKLWMHKFSAPLELNVKFSSNDLLDVLEKHLPEELWNPDDIANSAMALDCITTVSEDFFSRNDRFGMAFSMEGRFPLASKKYMEYCLSINSDYKFGKENKDTKLILKNSYNKIFPDYILNKQKTGWSVPITHWIENDDKIKEKYNSTINNKDGIEEILSVSNYQGNTKKKIITWIFRTWAQQFNMSL